MNDGVIVLWKSRSGLKFRNAHAGPVTAMCSMANGSFNGNETGPQVVSGGKDGMVKVWNIQLDEIWRLDMKLSEPKSVCPDIHALSTKDNNLLIGTKGAEIYQLDMLNNDIFQIVGGHFDARSELWGLAMHPKMCRFVTACDDMTVRVWDSKSKMQLFIANVGAKTRAVAYGPSGDQIAAATLDGQVIVLNDTLSQVLFDVTVSKSWIQVLQYSPDGRYLAVGAHDGNIYILETSSFSCLTKCKGHHGAITGIDFNESSNQLQSCAVDYELLYWDISGAQITSSTSMRDVVWASTTCMLGWGVQGIWPSCADGSDVNAVHRSPNGRYLVSGDDALKVKLFSYPCCKDKAQFKEYNGHAEHVMCVRFSHDSNTVISIGGLDKAIIQFEMVKETKSAK